MATTPQRVMHTLLGNSTRISERFQVGRDSTLRWNDGLPRDVIIEDLSCSGFRIAGGEALAAGEEIMVGLAGVGTRKATVIWSENDRTGCQFLRPISARELGATIVASTLVQGPSAWTGDSPAAQDQIDDLRSKPFSSRRSIALLIAAAIAVWIGVVAVASYGWILIR